MIAPALAQLVLAALPVVQGTDVLARDPASLPRAAEGCWKGWSPEAEVPADLFEQLVQAARAYTHGRYLETLAGLYGVLEEEPDYPPALHQAGVVHFRLRRYGTAIVLFERFLEVAPGAVGDTRALAHCYYSLGEYERARDHYARVLDESPDEVEALRGAALARMRLGGLEGALELLERVVSLDPEHADAWTWIAQIRYDRDELEEARAAGERACDLDPYEPRPWFVLSQILYDQGEAEEGDSAHARFETLERVDQELRALEARLLFEPDDLARLSRVAELHRSVGDRDGLREALARLIAARPSDVRVRVYVLDTLVAAGDAAAAAVAAAAMGEALPEEPEVWRRLERYYARTRDRTKQIQAGERYRRLLSLREAEGGS